MQSSTTFVLSLAISLGVASSASAARLSVSAVSASSNGLVWNKTIDDSGMSGDTQTLSDSHGTNAVDMGVSAAVSAPHWVRFDLGETKPLQEMRIWNYNAWSEPADPPSYAKGMKDVVIDHSLDSVSWTPIFSGTIPAASGLGNAVSPPDLIVPFNETMARFIRVTTAASPNHNHAIAEIGLPIFPEAGLSEVRFYKAEVTVPIEQVTPGNLMAVVVPGEEGKRYNLQRATSVEPQDWADTGTYVIGNGGDMTLYYATSDDTAEYYRSAVPGAGAILGSPNPANDWSTESVVSARASSELSPRFAVNLINGSGILEDGFSHGINSAAMWLANQFNVNQRGGTVSGGHWVEFKFTEPSDINTIQIWNYANNTDGNWKWTALGIRDVTIQYTTVGGGGGGDWGSDSPGDWTTAFTGTLAAYAPPHPGSGVFSASDSIDIGDVTAQYVVITASSDPALVNYISEEPTSSLTLAGLSEVRFANNVSYALADPGDLMTSQTGFRFTTGGGDVYSLRRDSSGGGTFETTGAYADGNGGEMVLYDPAGYSPTADYKVVIE